MMFVKECEFFQHVKTKKQIFIESIEELNSRLGSDEIPQRLNAMAAEIGQPDVLDVLMATNMISVGVDVDRLAIRN